MKLTGKSVLVTGGAGFIGSHLVDKLVTLGCSVRVADNLSRGALENIVHLLDRIDFMNIDLREYRNCLRATENVDYVFHLASAVGGVQYIRTSHVDNLTPSVSMNVNMPEAARRNDVDRFLFTSSACVYREGNGELNVFREQDAFPADPPTTYGWAKVLGEIACRSYHMDYGMKCVAVRIFNAYGENENLDPLWAHVIPSMIRRAILYPKESFHVFGDGKQERAFLYVKDCVEGLLRAIDRIDDGSPINMGSEDVISIADLAKRVIGLSRKEVEIVFDLSGPRGVNRYCADTTKMRELLDWAPSTSLDEGLERTYVWAKRRLLCQ